MLSVGRSAYFFCPSVMINPKNSAIAISVIVPVFNARTMLGKCLDAIGNSIFTDYELIIVDDGSKDGSKDIYSSANAKIIELSDGPYGPAYARNRGSDAAQGDILFFIDSDVVIYPDTIAKVNLAFKQRPEFDALFGSYDDEPGDLQFLSQYKNLSHAFVHQNANEEGSTFWSGCGAIRKNVFEKFGGFDAKRYPRPSIEDIDLGVRIKAAGGRIWVNKDIKVKHLKRWTFIGLLKTDIFDRAIPWTRLILRHRDLPNDLNLGSSQRLSSILTVILLGWMLGFPGLKNTLSFPLFWILLLAEVNCWYWRPGGVLARPDVGPAFIAGFFTGLFGIYTLLTGYYLFLPLILWIFVATLFIPQVARLAPQRQKLVFTSIMGAMGVAFGLLFFYLPLGYLIPILLLLGLIVGLNWGLYRFLAGERGIVFSTASLQLQLLYYVYSLASFGLGSLLHIWETEVRPRVYSHE